MQSVDFVKQVSCQRAMVVAHLSATIASVTRSRLDTAVGGSQVRCHEVMRHWVHDLMQHAQMEVAYQLVIHFGLTRFASTTSTLRMPLHCLAYSKLRSVSISMGQGAMWTSQWVLCFGAAMGICISSLEHWIVHQWLAPAECFDLHTREHVGS